MNEYMLPKARQGTQIPTLSERVRAIYRGRRLGIPDGTVRVGHSLVVVVHEDVPPAHRNGATSVEGSAGDIVPKRGHVPE